MSTKKRRGRKVVDYIPITLKWDKAQLTCSLEYWATWDDGRYVYHNVKPKKYSGPLQRVKRRMFMVKANPHLWKRYNLSTKDIQAVLQPNHKLYKRITSMENIRTLLMTHPLWILNSIANKTIEVNPTSRQCTCKWILQNRSKTLSPVIEWTEKNLFKPSGKGSHLSHKDPEYVPLQPLVRVTTKEFQLICKILGSRQDDVVPQLFKWNGCTYLPEYLTENRVFMTRVVTLDTWKSLGNLTPEQNPINFVKPILVKGSKYIPTLEGCFMTAS